MCCSDRIVFHLERMFLPLIFFTFVWWKVLRRLLIRIRKYNFCIQMTSSYVDNKAVMSKVSSSFTIQDKIYHRNVYISYIKWTTQVFFNSFMGDKYKRSTIGVKIFYVLKIILLKIYRECCMNVITSSTLSKQL